MLSAEKDPMGQAIYDYHFQGKNNAVIQVMSSITFPDILPVKYLFRTYPEMSGLEKKALSMSHGKILDVGAGAGCHSVYLKNKNNHVTCLDTSELSCHVLADRGMKEVVNDSIFSYTGQPFDTILMLMNGIGICGTIERLNTFFQKAGSLLAQGGNILVDSSDIRYMFEDEEGVVEINLNDNYYGEIQYKMQYSNVLGEEFDWLFIDFDTLAFYAETNGFVCEKIMDGPHYDYLAIITGQL